MHELAQAQLQTAEDLIRVSHPELLYGVYHLVFPPDTDDGHLDIRGVEHWSWLGPSLLNALRREPGQFARQVAHLISVGRHGENPSVILYVVDRELLTGFFGNRAGEVVRILERQRDRAEGNDRVVLDQVVRSAAASLPPAGGETH